MTQNAENVALCGALDRSTHAFRGSNATGLGPALWPSGHGSTQGALALRRIQTVGGVLTTSVCAGCHKRHPGRWLTVEEIRKQQRMRRKAVIEAMSAGALPFEQRGRFRYARACDVEAWEKTRLSSKSKPNPKKVLVHRDLSEFT